MKWVSALAVVVVGSSVASAQLSYTFDSDAQGWRRGNLDLASLTLTDIGVAAWNASGFIEADDFSDYAFHLSPSLGGVNMGNTYGGVLRLDFATVSASPAGPAQPFVVLTNGTGALFRPQSFADNTPLTTSVFSLDTTGGWQYGTSIANIAPATESQIRSILGNLTRIGVTADVADGTDSTAVDNLRLVAPVPEPATIAALGLGAVAILRRRRRAR